MLNLSVKCLTCVLLARNVCCWIARDFNYEAVVGAALGRDRTLGRPVALETGARRRRYRQR